MRSKIMSRNGTPTKALAAHYDAMAVNAAASALVGQAVTLHADGRVASAEDWNALTALWLANDPRVTVRSAGPNTYGHTDFVIHLHPTTTAR